MTQQITPNQALFPPTQPPETRIRYRIRFAKTDMLRWIGHTDLAMLWQRMARRAGLRLSMTEGFHPKPRIAFPSALALGAEGTDEVAEIELAEDIDEGVLKQCLIDDRQPGLTIHSVQRLDEGAGKAQLATSTYEIEVPDGVDMNDVYASIAELLSKDTVTIVRKEKPKTLVTASQIETLEVCNQSLHRSTVLRMTLIASPTASLRPSDVLELLNISDWPQRGATIVRTNVRLEQKKSNPNQSRTIVSQPTKQQRDN